MRLSLLFTSGTQNIWLLIYILLQAFQNLSRLLVSHLINLKYNFNIPIRITRKTIIMGTSFQFMDGVQLKTLPKLSLEILILNWVQKKPL